MQTRTARYLDLVHHGRNAWWRYALGILTIALFWMGVGYLPYARFGDVIADDPLLDFVAVNFSILMMLAGLAVTVKFIHGRTLWSVITPDARVDSRCRPSPFRCPRHLPRSRRRCCRGWRGRAA